MIIVQPGGVSTRTYARILNTATPGTIVLGYHVM